MLCPEILLASDTMHAIHVASIFLLSVMSSQVVPLLDREGIFWRGPSYPNILPQRFLFVTQLFKLVNQDGVWLRNRILEVDVYY